MMRLVDVARELLEGHPIYHADDSDEVALMKAVLAIPHFKLIENSIRLAREAYEAFVTTQMAAEEQEDSDLNQEAQRLRREYWDRRHDARKLFDEAKALLNIGETAPVRV